MAVLKLNLHPPHSQLASFGRFWTPLFSLILAGILWTPENIDVCLLLLAVAMVVAVVGWCRAAWLRVPFVGAMLITYPIGVVVGFVLMGVVYYGCVCPTGLVLKLMGKDLLQQKWNLQANTYWVKRKPNQTMDRYFRQF